MRSARLLILLAAAIPAGCASSQPTEPEDPALRHRLALVLLQQERGTTEIPSEDNFIWFGRRLAYLGRYDQAVVEFTQGLEQYPSSHKLLRHRGHRWITLRRFDLAVDDLERAAELIQGMPDEIEPDGLPNPRNIPTSTSHTNIYYHLGLARYLRGEFDLALAAYERCMAFSKNDDMRCATAYWLYLTQRRLGMDDAARATLTGISRRMNIIENTAYHELLMMYKAVENTDFNYAAANGQGLIERAYEDATLGYGVGAWLLLNGREDGARLFFDRIVNSTPPAAFGHIAAEVELAGR